MTTRSDDQAAVKFSELSPGASIDVETMNRHYSIECMGGDLIRICGHPDFCPTPASALLRGSLDDEGELVAGLVEPGMRLLYFVDDLGPVATSRVVRVQVEEDRANTFVG